MTDQDRNGDGSSAPITAAVFDSDSETNAHTHRPRDSVLSDSDRELSGLSNGPPFVDSDEEQNDFSHGPGSVEPQDSDQDLDVESDALSHPSAEDSTQAEAEPFTGQKILDLLMPTYSGGMKDEFGKDFVPPLPLAFDRICEGRRPVSTSRLFRLPYELIDRILLSLPQASLAQLAFVNSDCRQLARSRQFVSLCLDYSDKAIQIVSLLMREGLERGSFNGHTSKLALGPCIRHLALATQSGWITHRHGVAFNEGFTSKPREIVNKICRKASDMFFGSYLSSIVSLLGSRTTMPHLQYFDLEDSIVLQPSFFDALVNSSIQHIKLDRIKVDKAFVIPPPLSQPSKSWPLQSLQLDVHPAMGDPDIDVSRLCTSLLHACAPTLENLTWGSCTAENVRTDGLAQSPPYPSLRRLRMFILPLQDDALLSRLLHDNLQCLQSDLGRTPAMKSFFETRGNIPALETLIWDDIKSHKTQSLPFLQANPQLKKFSSPQETSPPLLETHILPMFQHSFTRLTSLSLTWEQSYIPSTAVEMIAGLATLEQLHLSAGVQIGWRHNWLIDHDMMREYLSKLPRLKKIAFSRDSYSNGLDEEDAEVSYYETKILKPENLSDSKWTDGKFEIEHRWRMVREALKYIRKVPKLEWFYFGQVPMATSKHVTKPNKAVVTPLFHQRDDCYTLLHEMFGWKGLMPT